MDRGGAGFHAARGHVAFYVITGVGAERRRGRRAEVGEKAVRVKHGGFGHRVHVVQAGIGALLLRPGAQPRRLRLQRQLFAHRVAVVKGRLRPTLLLLPLFHLLAQLVLGGRLSGLA